MIVCLGTTPTFQRTMTFARLSTDAVNRAARIDEYASGKAINAARVVHALGEPVLCIGPTGGHRGGPLLADLSDQKIPHDFAICASATRLCITLLDQSAATATELVEEAATLSERTVVELLSKLKQHARRTQVLVLSGSLAPGVSTDFYARCIETAPNAAVIVDAVGDALLETLRLKPRVIKPNQSEVAKTLGVEISSESALRNALLELHRRGAQAIVCTRGKAGATVSDGQSFVTLESPTVDAINPIGSGDSVAAGIACALRRGESLSDAAKLGIACGAANALTRLSGEVQRADVDRLISQVRISTQAL